MVAVICALLGVASAAMAANNPPPLVNQPLVPDAVAPGGASFMLTVNGTGFVAQSVVNWNGSPRQTTFVAASQLMAKINAADIASAGTAGVTVVNPAPGGGTSNVAYLVIAASSSHVGFQQARHPPVPGSPLAMAVGDFNGDGNLDLAVAGLGTAHDTVTVLLGDGNGSFTPASVSTVGQGPTSIAVGDFNGDGNLDMAVANSDDGTVTVLLGDGTGNFNLASVPTAGPGPDCVAAGDFNGDGHLDLAVADYAGNALTILLGDGAGNFSSSTFPSPENPFRIAVGDYNDDGRLDLAVANDNDKGTVSILLGDGASNFSKSGLLRTGGNPSSLVTGDFNGDGILDLAVENWEGNSLSIFLGDRNGQFTLIASPAITQPFSLAVGDFNADGIPDLAVGVYGGSPGRITFFLGDGTGNFNIAATRQTGGINSIIAGDFNGDGRMDVAGVADSSRPSTFVLLQGPAGKLSPPYLDFGSQEDGTTSPPQTVTITNEGYAAIKITGVILAGKSPSAYSVTNNCPSSLAVGGSCTASVVFSPTTGGALLARLMVTGTGGFNPFGVTLTGTGLDVVLNPTSLDFGSVMVGQTSPPMSSALTNVGSTNLVITRIILKGNDPGDFSETDTCPRNLPAGGTCTITVIFTPTQTGSRTANVNIQDYGGDSPQKIALSGTGTQ